MLLIFVTVFWEKHTYFRHLLSSLLNWTEELMVQVNVVFQNFNGENNVCYITSYRSAKQDLVSRFKENVNKPL